jgi:hypothetical protein
MADDAVASGVTHNSPKDIRLLSEAVRKVCVTVKLFKPSKVERIADTVAALCEALVCGRSLAEIVGSNSNGGMNVCFLECCVLSGKSQRRSDP